MKISDRRFFTATVTFDDKDYELICIPDESRKHPMYEFYLQPADHVYPMEFMLGLPIDQQSIEEAFSIAEGNVPDYVEEFKENIWYD